MINQLGRHIVHACICLLSAYLHAYAACLSVCLQGICELSMKQRTVSRCVDMSCPGSMVVDELGAQYGASSGSSGKGGGHWKLACNELGCLKIVRLHSVVRSITHSVTQRANQKRSVPASLSQAYSPPQ